MGDCLRRPDRARARGGDGVSHFEVIHCPDSFAWLRGLADSVVDHVITDPPFSEHVQGNMCSGSVLKANAEAGGGGVPKIDLPFAALSDYAFAADLVRVARRWSISFCAVEDFGTYRNAVGGHRSADNPRGAYVRGGIWIKPNAMGQLTRDRPASAYEGLAIMHRPGGKMRWNGRGSYAVWCSDTDELPSDEATFYANGTRGEVDRHPNQKSLRHCLELVAKFTDRGDSVLDPFCGFGRIGEACLLLGRQYIGLDNNAVPGSVERARARLITVEAAGFGRVSDADCLRLCALPRHGDPYHPTPPAGEEVPKRARRAKPAPQAADRPAA